MPDGSPVSVASAFPFLLSSPSRLIPAAIAAVTPLLDPAEDALSALRAGLGHKDVATALDPIIGTFTVADAVMVADAVDMAADYQSIFTSNDSAALTVTWFALRDFILSAHPTCREDVAAREGYLIAQSTTIPSDFRPVLWRRMRLDVSELLGGAFRNGHLFGGAQTNSSEDDEPEPWWDFHKRMINTMAD